MDGVSLPTALLVLAVVLRSARLLLLPLAALAVATALAFAVMRVVASSLTIVSITPSLMSSTLIALSIDFSLFICSRYRTELRHRQSPRAAVERTLSHAGHTILISGATLFGCFLGLVGFPLEILRSLGIGAATVVAAAVLVNLSLTPTLLLAFPRFFSRCVKRTEAAAATLRVGRGDAAAATSDVDVPAVYDFRLKDMNEQDDDENSNNNYDDDDDESETLAARATSRLSQFWLWLGFSLQRFPCNVLVLAVVIGVIGVPVGRHATTLRTSAGMALMLPGDTPLAGALGRMSSEFGFGAVLPIRLLLVPPPTLADAAAAANASSLPLLGNFSLPPWLRHVPVNGGGGGGGNTSNAAERIAPPAPVATRRFFQLSVALIDALVAALPSTNASNFAGISYVNPSFLRGALVFDIGVACGCWQRTDAPPPPLVGAHSIEACETACAALHYTRRIFVDAAWQSTWFAISLSFNPLSADGRDWVQATRAVLTRLTAADGAYAGWSATITGAAVISADAVDTVYRAFPTLVGVTAAVVLVFLAVALRSALLPAHAAASIALTLAVVYGATSLVYVAPGVLQWLPLDGLHPTDGGFLFWLAPVICFAIVTGFALDYTIFVVVRIAELRRSGHAHGAAVALGVADTGGSVTAAGVIMAIAFFGMLFSSVVVINQMAFILVTAVLFDTFVVRTLVVAPLLSLTRDATWWPSRVPPPADRMAQYDEFGMHIRCRRRRDELL